MADADVVLAVQPPALDVIDAMKEGAILISFIYAGHQPALVKRLIEKKITCFAMEMLPRITRAQSMDALSSQSALAGYYAVQLGATHLGRVLPKITTAAGAIGPAKVLVMGLGVAGLEALATAHRLGAVTEGYDVRPETQEQALSLGATFVETGVDATGKGGYARALSAEEKGKVAAVLTKHIQQSDLIITTAAIPGRPSPKLISKAQVAGMKAGAVIVDLSAEGGGNCEDTQPGKTVEIGQVTIVAPAERALAARRGRQRALRQEPVQPARPDDEGQHHRDRLGRRDPRRAPSSPTPASSRTIPPSPKPTPAAEPSTQPPDQPPKWREPDQEIAMNFDITMTGFIALYVFMLAAFAGWVIIGRVPAILHTPLMSGSNFVHGIVVVGGIFALLNASTTLEQTIGFFAVLLGAGNAAGGYAVTDRMLAMFQVSGHKTKHAKHGRAKAHRAKKDLRNGHVYYDLATGHRHHRSRRGVSLSVRPQAHVVAGDGAVRDLRRRHRHARRDRGKLSLRLQRRARQPSRSCRSISASPSSPSSSAAAPPGGAARRSR